MIDGVEILKGGGGWAKGSLTQKALEERGEHFSVVSLMRRTVSYEVESNHLAEESRIRSVGGGLISHISSWGKLVLELEFRVYFNHNNSAGL